MGLNRKTDVGNAARAFRAAAAAIENLDTTSAMDYAAVGVAELHLTNAHAARDTLRPGEPILYCTPETLAALAAGSVEPPPHMIGCDALAGYSCNCADWNPADHGGDWTRGS